jgi:hypothetical protein
LFHRDAQRASLPSSSGDSPTGRSRQTRPRTAHVRLVAAVLLAVVGLGVIPSVASAATSIHVVVVVGPVESTTSRYLADGHRLAAQAKSYGARVTEIYSPNATWAKVSAALKGADLLIYLGHGNGWPSPYGPFQDKTKDGLGLNASAGHGHYNLKYYGSYYLARYIRMATHAVVILNHLCYSAGNSEPGRANPTKSVATQRIDNFASGFLRTGADVVFAEPRGDPSYILYDLFKTSKTMRQIFWDSPQAKHTYSFTFASTKTKGTTAISDPASPGKYYRSVAGYLSLRASTWR